MTFTAVDVKTEKPSEASGETEPKEPETKPKWLTCLALTVSALTIIISAISVGMVIGYSFCYFEHRTDLLHGNYTRLGLYEIVDTSDMMTEVPPYNENRTINGAIKQAVMSSILISKILNTVRHLAQDTGPFEHDKQLMRMTNLWDIFPEQETLVEPLENRGH